MHSLFYSISFLLTISIHSFNCEHEYHHQNDKWPLILSKIEFLWKNKTDAPSTSTTEQTEIHDQEAKTELFWESKIEDPSTTTSKQTEKYNHKGNHWHSHSVESTTEFPTTPVVQNGTFMENVKETFKASMALLVGVPIAGIIVLCCFCYCCLKCCAACCCESSEEGKVIVVQQNNTQQSIQPPAQHTQVILQQPVYQTPVYTMQPPQYGPVSPQYGPAPPQQWAVPPHQHHPSAYDNPDYREPSAPPPQYGKY